MIENMSDTSTSEQIDDIIKKHGGWKGELLSRLRDVITSADPKVVEDVKWKMPTRPEGLPVWSHDGMLCFAEIWKDNVKLLFSKGAQLQDPSKLFNARLKSSDLRAIEFHEGDSVDKTAIKALVQEAIKLNTAKT
jgi:hypothetical protein